MQTILVAHKLFLGIIDTESGKLLVYIDLGKYLSIIHGLWRLATEEILQSSDVDFFQKKSVISSGLVFSLRL